jgi:hypothetical protein
VDAVSQLPDPKRARPRANAPEHGRVENHRMQNRHADLPRMHQSHRRSRSCLCMPEVLPSYFYR